MKTKFIEQTPDDRTICNFRKDNADALYKVFREFNKFCLKAATFSVVKQLPLTAQSFVRTIIAQIYSPAIMSTKTSQKSKNK